MEKQKPNYIYLLQEPRFIQTNESVYKVGKTKQANLTRFNQYPKGSVLLLQTVCSNCDLMEVNIIKLFKTKYIRRKDIGNEYFEGNLNDMTDDIMNCLKGQNKYFEGNFNDINNYLKTHNEHFCEKCNYNTNKKQDYKKHLLTNKHLDNNTDKNIFICINCDKKYLYQSGLCKHKKSCKGKKEDTEIVNTLIEQNKKIDNLEKLIIELSKVTNSTSNKQ